MPLKLPPPPLFTGPQWEGFNRWLLELTSILSSAGDIDPSTVIGLLDAYAQIAQNTSDISSLGSQLTGVNQSISQLSIDISNLALRTTILEARAQIRNGAGVPSAGLGNDGDLYLNNTGGAGTRLYGKIGGAWVSIA